MDFYKLISKGYDELYGEEQKVKHDIIKANLNIRTDDLLLDVGCGTGSDFNCRVIGMDPSMDLLQQKTKNKIQATAENIPFKSNIFDKVISVTSIHNFNDIRQGIKEIKRVGKKDFAFSILKKTKHFEFIEKEIKNSFSVKKIIDTRQDSIFICSKILSILVVLKKKRCKKLLVIV